MEQQIRFCTTSDGVAHSLRHCGPGGPPLVRGPGWLSHLQSEWELPGRAGFLGGARLGDVSWCASTGAAPDSVDRDAQDYLPRRPGA